MRLVIQRVTRAAVRVGDETVGEIGEGLLVLVGVREGDTELEAQRLAVKTAELRIFRDDEGRFNRSLLEVGPGTASERAEALVVSQFTLYGDVRRGRRPSFNEAARPELAEPLVEAYTVALEAEGLRVARGRFGAMMQVESVNDGPVTIIVDSADFEKRRRGRSQNKRRYRLGARSKPAPKLPRGQESGWKTMLPGTSPPAPSPTSERGQFFRINVCSNFKMARFRAYPAARRYWRRR